MASNVYSRLDDRSVEDPILRSYLHKEVMAQCLASDAVNNFTYEIKLDEVYRTDLAAYRCWGSMDLRWVFRLLAGHESLDEAMEPGTVFTVPSAAWIRDRVRHWADTPELERET
ncbi:TPA: baseplate protein [Enterobacter hormaechei subsp. xiangfangensis]|nr:baseplate protein [Enterobacter hormaechei subsp. xiangfangensis]HAV1890658.1 baseplate protein [Enterobacter hormaechei subsp. xiangfangensis]